MQPEMAAAMRRIGRATLPMGIMLLAVAGCSGTRPAQPGEGTRDASAFITAQLTALDTLAAPDNVPPVRWSELKSALRHSLEQRLTAIRSGAAPRGISSAPTSPAAAASL